MWNTSWAKLSGIYQLPGFHTHGVLLAQLQFTVQAKGEISFLIHGLIDYSLIGWQSYVLYSYVQKHDDGRVSYPLLFVFISPQGKCNLLIWLVCRIKNQLFKWIPQDWNMEDNSYITNLTKI